LVSGFDVECAVNPFNAASEIRGRHAGGNQFGADAP
jgi:hypothetical protein